MSGMKPITREEFYLNKLAGEEQNTPEPVTREEQYLSRLCGADNIIPQKPELRREYFLAALCGEEVETPEPVTRIEQYMNFAAGKSQSKPEKAITREEMYWDKYQGGAVPEEKTVQGDIIHITDATGDNAVALSVALTPTQDGTPWISDTLNTEPYLSRAAQNGNKADETIVGGTVAWNQLVTFQTGSSTSHDVTFERKADGSVVVNGTATGLAYVNLGDTMYGVNGHKILIVGCPSGGSASTYYLRDGYTAGKYDKGSGLIIAKNDDRMVPQIGVALGTTMSNTVFKPQFFDLTQRFGSTIADYVYSLEQAEAGAGVAWLRSHGFIDDNYHAYNPGALISAKPTAKTVGDTTYTLGGADLRGLFKLDANNNLYCDGDVYTSDGTITRNYRLIADMSGMSWSVSSIGGYNRFVGTLPVDTYSRTSLNCICPLYETANNPTYGNNKDKTICTSTTKYVYLRDDSCSTVEELYTKLANVPFLYKITTPTTEASTPYTNPQKAGEAESFVDSRAEKVPVGHSTRYSAEYAINGFEGVTVHVSETQTGGTTYPVTFTSQGTVYGGTIDVVSGELKITWGYIASYNGETLPGVWMSSKEVYAEGTSPSLGAEVSYILSTPITATIDPTEIELNEGENYVWTEEGTTTLTYMARAAQRVLAMNKALQKNLNAIELKKGGDVK